MCQRTQEQVIGAIHRQREELVSAVADVRRDMTREIEQLRRVAKRQLPKVGASLGLLVAAVIARKIVRRRRVEPGAIERLRVGRYSLVEHL